MLTTDLAPKSNGLRSKVKSGLWLPSAKVDLGMKGLIQRRSCSNVSHVIWLARGTCTKEVVYWFVCFFSVGSITVYLSSLNDMSVSMAWFIRQMKQGKIFSIFGIKKNKKESEPIMASTAFKEQRDTIAI